MGCGDGIMLNVLRTHGWQVFGNERTLGVAQVARHQFNVPIFVGGLDSLSPTPIADLIILFQVLEHLDDPMKTLMQLNLLTKPSGKLIIAVPNFGSWQSRIGGKKWLHLDVPRHLFHFSLQSLNYCLNKSGFAITQVSYRSFEHDPYGWSQSILNRLFKSHNRLTRSLMRLEKTSILSVIHLVLAALISILSLPITIASWFFNSGAIIEVTAEKVKSI
jgi:SAM-dependent methyltransferase